VILLDTHALLWWITKDPRLSKRAAREIGRARSALVSPVSLWEVAVLVRERRIRLDRDLFGWIADVFARDSVSEAPLTATAAASAGSLGRAFGGDVADRFLYATARELAVPIATKDRAIRSFARSTGDVRTIW
jgi:PIN domain nuclease of toxin-antitoxin system